MDELTRFLLDMVYLLLIAGGCSIIFSKLRMPAITGYLAAGLILGPTMLREVSVQESTIFLLSNLGIVLLMFYIGMELNFKRLRKIGTFIFAAMTIQMVLMVIIGYLSGLAIGLDHVASIFLGAIISGTSTAVVVAVLKDRKLLDPEVAETVIIFTVLEDIGQVFILTLAAPLLVGDTPALGSTVLMVVGIVVFFGLSIIIGSALVPRVLEGISRKFPSEVLIIVAIGMCFAMALLSNYIGLSIAIGAFLMGTLVSQSSVAPTVKAKVEPMKDVFMAVFFIDVGIQVVPAEIIGNLWLVLAIVVVFMGSKIVAVSTSCFISGRSGRTSLIIALSLPVMGEFAFVIAKMALDAEVVAPSFYAAVIGAALATMLLMPPISKKADEISDLAVRISPKWFSRLLRRFEDFRCNVVAWSSRSIVAAKNIKQELTMFLIDLTTLGIVLVLFQVLGFYGGTPFFHGDGTDVFAQWAIFGVSLGIVLPVVVNMVRGIRRLSKTLAFGDDWPGVNSSLYKAFRNMGSMILVLILLILFLPFIPSTDELSTQVWISFLGILVLSLVLARTSYRNAHERIKQALASKNMSANEACPVRTAEGAPKGTDASDDPSNERGPK